MILTLYKFYLLEKKDWIKDGKLEKEETLEDEQAQACEAFKG